MFLEDQPHPSLGKSIGIITRRDEDCLVSRGYVTKPADMAEQTTMSFRSDAQDVDPTVLLPSCRLQLLLNPAFS